MGYETKLIIGKNYKGTDCFETFAELKLSGMPNEFFKENVFTNEVTFKVFQDGEETDTDRYGKKITYGTVEDVLKVLYRCEGQEHYRRTEMAINMLKTFTNKNDWDDVIVLNYGY